MNSLLIYFPIIYNTDRYSRQYWFHSNRRTKAECKSLKNNDRIKESRIFSVYRSKVSSVKVRQTPAPFYLKHTDGVCRRNFKFKAKGKNIFMFTNTLDVIKNSFTSYILALVYMYVYILLYGDSRVTWIAIVWLTL